MTLFPGPVHLVLCVRQHIELVSGGLSVLWGSARWDTGLGIHVSPRGCSHENSVVVPVGTYGRPHPVVSEPATRSSSKLETP